MQIRIFDINRYILSGLGFFVSKDGVYGVLLVTGKDAVLKLITSIIGDIIIDNDDYYRIFNVISLFVDERDICFIA
jgi:hypothetical protein